MKTDQLKICDITIYNGRNIYSHRPIIKMVVDIGKYGNIPTNEVPGFNENLIKMFPGLKTNCCSLGYTGGFLERLNEGTYLGHVLEHVDIHTLTASQVFDTELSAVTGDMRSAAKAVNFGIVYGIGEYSLSQDIHVSVKEAKRYIENYLNKYQGVKGYMETIKESAKKQGYVETLFGRRRYIPELSSNNFNLRAFGERVALNTPIQGTAADIIKIAMVRVEERLDRECPKAKLLLQVHDELIVEADDSDVELASKILKEEMEHAADLKVALLVDLKSGHSWFDTK